MFYPFLSKNISIKMIDNPNNVLTVEPNQLRENIFNNIKKLNNSKNTSLFSYLGIGVAFPELKKENHALSAGVNSLIINAPNVVISESSAGNIYKV